MPKRGSERGRSWFGLSAFLVVAAGGTFLVWWLFHREPAPRELRYGELIQILNASREGGRVSVRNVRVTHAEVRGEIVTTDPVSDGANATHTQTVRFRTLRSGLENDQGLHELLQSAVGAGYEGADEESPLKALGQGLLTLLLCVVLGGTLFLALRWMSGGASP